MRVAAVTPRGAGGIVARVGVAIRVDGSGVIAAVGVKIQPGLELGLPVIGVLGQRGEDITERDAGLGLGGGQGAEQRSRLEGSLVHGGSAEWKERCL